MSDARPNPSPPLYPPLGKGGNQGGYPQGEASSQAILRLENVGIRFGRQEVIRDLNLAVRRGETVVIVGESGCGKTVLLKLIVGLLQPHTGRIVFDGKVLAELSEQELNRERQRFGFLFQGAALFDSLNVFDNVAFALREHTKLAKQDIRARVRQRLFEVGLPAEVEGKKPAELSGGMRKRVGLARAVILNPELMLYDEPTTGLDPIMSDVINELILQTRRQPEITTIVVTHDLRTVEKVAERIIMLYPVTRLQPGEAQVIFDGTVDELRQCQDPRVTQFVKGEARDRLTELAHGTPSERS